MALTMLLSVGGVAVHLVPLFTDLGADPACAGGIASLLGLAIITGRNGIGILLDRLRPT